MDDNCIGHLETVYLNEVSHEDEVEFLSFLVDSIITLQLIWLTIICHSPAREVELSGGHHKLFVFLLMQLSVSLLLLAGWWVLSLWLCDLLHGWLLHLWLRDLLLPGFLLLILLCFHSS